MIDADRRVDENGDRNYRREELQMQNAQLKTMMGMYTIR